MRPRQAFGAKARVLFPLHIGNTYHKNRRDSVVVMTPLASGTIPATAIVRGIDMKPSPYRSTWISGNSIFFQGGMRKPFIAQEKHANAARKNINDTSIHQFSTSG